MSFDKVSYFPDIESNYSTFREQEYYQNDFKNYITLCALLTLKTVLYD